MTPIEYVLILAVVALGSAGWMANRVLNEQIVELLGELSKLGDRVGSRPPATVDRSDHDLVKLALEEMSKVSQMALNPYPAGPPAADADGLHPPRQMTALEMIVDDEADPMEVFLGPDYLRETSAVLGSDDESPFGVPGLRATGGLT